MYHPTVARLTYWALLAGAGPPSSSSCRRC